MKNILNKKLLAILFLLAIGLAACGGADNNNGLSDADRISTEAAALAFSVLTQTAEAMPPASATPLPVTNTPEPTATFTSTVEVPTNSLSDDLTASPTVSSTTSGAAVSIFTSTPDSSGATLAPVATQTSIIPTPTAASGTSGGSGSSGSSGSDGCVWTASFNYEDPPYDGQKIPRNDTRVKTWYVTNTSRDASGNGCTWYAGNVELFWVATYRSDNSINWAPLSDAQKKPYLYSDKFGLSSVKFVPSDNPVSYGERVAITLTIETPPDDGYYRIEWVIAEPSGKIIPIDGGGLWYEPIVYTP